MIVRRLVVFLSLLMLSACALDAGDDAPDETVRASEEAITAGPQWNMVTLIFKRIDADYVQGGAGRHAKTTMTQARIDEFVARADKAKNLFSTWNGGRAFATMAKLVVDEPITHITRRDGDEGYWVAPSDVAAQLDKYAPRGRYDSVFVVWDPLAAEPDIPACCSWGRGPGDDTNGMTYASMNPNNPAEGVIHEWLHGAGAFYRGKGFDVPDPHDSRVFGHPGPNAQGSWSDWYVDLMRGYTLRAHKSVGYTSPVWRSGTPTHWVGGSYPAPAKPFLATPTIQVANITRDGWVYLQWKPVHRPSHYSELIAILKADGSLGKNLYRYEQPGIDRGSYDYTYFHKDAVCSLARESGVSLAAVRFFFQIWADDDPTTAINRNVDGTLDCR